MMRLRNYNEPSRLVKERRVVKVPTVEQRGVENAAGATAKSKQSYFRERVQY